METSDTAKDIYAKLLELFNVPRLEFPVTIIGTHDVTGYIDEVRVTKGFGRYAANFSPPTAAFPDPTVSLGPVDTWSKFSATFTVPNGANGLNFAFQFSDTVGSLWFDDIIIRRVVQENIVGVLPQAKVFGLPTKIGFLELEDFKTNNAIYNSYFGSGGNGTAEDTAAAITDIKAKLAGEWNIETITTSRTWTRANSWTTTPSDLWVVCCGSGNGGGSGEQRLNAELSGQGGEGGRWLVKQVIPSTVPETVTCTVGVATAGSSTSHLSPNNGQHTSFGSLCATNDGITASIVSFISYYSADDARPGRGGNGGGPLEPSWNGANGQSTPLAAGGIGSSETSNGGPGGAAVLTGDTRAGGGGGGGGGGAGGLDQGRNGGNGGHPGGGGGGGGVQSSAAGSRSVGGGGAAGVIILMWR